MKLAALALITTLGFGGAAHADPRYVPPPPPAAPPGYPAPAAQAYPTQPAHPRGQFRQLLLERFDRNHDGHLDSAERRRAIRAIRMLARRLTVQELRAEHQAARARRARRFDADRGPDDSRPARRFRPRDRDADGWVDDRARE